MAGGIIAAAHFFPKLTPSSNGRAKQTQSTCQRFERGMELAEMSEGQGAARRKTPPILVQQLARACAPRGHAPSSCLLPRQLRDFIEHVLGDVNGNGGRNAESDRVARAAVHLDDLPVAADVDAGEEGMVLQVIDLN